MNTWGPLLFCVFVTVGSLACGETALALLGAISTIGVLVDMSRGGIL